MSDAWNVVQGWRDMPDRGWRMRLYDKAARCGETTWELVRVALQGWECGVDGWPELLTDALTELRSRSCNLESRLVAQRDPASGQMEPFAEFRLSEWSSEIVKVAR